NALLRSLHERDPEWAQRLVSTADLAGAVCQQLNVPAADAARIRQAAQLHDIGKVGLPDEILRKPTRLTPDEWAFIHQAPAIGEQDDPPRNLAVRTPRLSLAANAITAHRRRQATRCHAGSMASQQTPGFDGQRIRASDAEREQVAHILRTAMGEGRLTLDEGE